MVLKSRNVSQGSALLLVLLFLSGLLLLAFPLMQKIGFLMSIQGLSYKHEQQYQLTRAALEWGVALCKDRMEQVQPYLAKHERLTIKLYDEPWGPVFQVFITITGKNPFIITAQLKNLTTVVCHLGCSLRIIKNENTGIKKLFIYNFHKQK